MSDHGAIVVLTTVEDAAAARVMAAKLVEERLAACVSWHALNSVYQWKGALEEQSECLLIVKTASGRWPALQARISQLSSYDTPEILALEAAQASASYLAWLLESVSES